MKISMDKKYKTRNGKPVRLLCVDAKMYDDKHQLYPVIGLISNSENHHTLFYWTEFGSYMYYTDNKVRHFIEGVTDLIEVLPYEDFKIDEPVLVKVNGGPAWQMQHFAGVDENGLPLTWEDGKTSWTTKVKLFWDQCKRP